MIDPFGATPALIPLDAASLGGAGIVVWSSPSHRSPDWQT